VPLRIALAGIPNTGKTTLFNALTGLRHRVGNYPGITVEKRWGSLRLNGVQAELLDLPGSYSLDAASQEERVVCDVLTGMQNGAERPDGLVVVVDPFHLERDLYFVSQLHGIGLPMVLAINFWDEVRKKRLHIDLALLEKRFHVSAVPVSALRGEGLEALKKKMLDFSKNSSASPRSQWVKEDVMDAKRRYQGVEENLKGIVRHPPKRDPCQEMLDQIFLHPVLGPVLFLAVTLLIFQSIFTWALWPMGWIQSGVDFLGRVLSAVIPSTLLRSFLVNGILAGVGSIIVFLPQIAILFLFIGILNDTGYLARGAFLLDKLMSKVGLNGKSFLPLFSCFACAVPGIMATRTIENRKERLVTILVSPFMTCSARLPIYALVTAALIPPIAVGRVFNLQGIVFLSMYLLGIFAAMIMAWIFKRGIRSSELSHFFLELPPYRMPHWKTVFLLVRNQIKVFLKTAGSVILILSMVLWALMSFPSHVLEESIAGKVGHWMEPVLRPLGFDWKIDVGILASFAQREVFVSTLAIVHRIESTTVKSASRDENFLKLLQSHYTPLVGLSILVFYALACQCMSTLAVVRREAGSWKWPIFMFAYMSFLAYGASFFVYQGGRLLGFH